MHNTCTCICQCCDQVVLSTGYKLQESWSCFHHQPIPLLQEETAMYLITKRLEL
ncbi:hypothetical protein HanXRQr2_Chr01g0028101 [Helianthus annuus]|uniref:Uncharacterized protein n=1 Tax=Helianthus annuus TaxID=4232 RepID=A0A9K3JVR0_HELAN|nr:hypothetical protein HanXRQr2_Chr01g0028101 [Helianthus annuus]KAJ0957413.1 hypothetical protein HanPSC8_Chr01g0027021 [Helianthus annuus]